MAIAHHEIEKENLLLNSTEAVFQGITPANKAGDQGSTPANNRTSASDNIGITALKKRSESHHLESVTGMQNTCNSSLPEIPEDLEEDFNAELFNQDLPQSSLDI